MKRERTHLTIARQTEEGERKLLLDGRTAWALYNLIEAGPKGCTPIDNPAPRWSAYIFKLRHDYDIAIETVVEPHGGPFAGRHGRYVLREPLRVIEREAA